MIATWMVYAFVVSVLVGLAGWAFERAARTARLPGRMVWLGSLIVSVAVPLYALANPAKISGIAPVLTTSAGESNGFSFPTLPALPLVDAYSSYIAAGWVAVSGVLLAIVVLTLRRIATETETLPTDDVDGIQVRRSVFFGPALVGILRPQVVIPGWLGDVHPAAENLAARHEASHRVAGDAELQLAGLLLAIVMAWNPVVWWQFLRLREAVELDCDIRLLRGGADMKTYATLLLEIAGNRTRSPFPAVAFLPNTTQLGRRVTTMAEHKKPPRYLKTALIAAAGVTLAATACETPQPAEVGTANESAVRAEITAEHFGRMQEITGMSAEELRLHLDSAREAMHSREGNEVHFGPDGDAEAAGVLHRQMIDGDFSATEMTDGEFRSHLVEVELEAARHHEGQAEATFEYSETPWVLYRVPAPEGAENEFSFDESEVRLREVREEQAAARRFGPRPEN